MSDIVVASLDLARQAVVAVGDGRGFVFNGNNRRLIVTAAHCLRSVPEAGSLLSAHERTYPLLKALDANGPSIWAECLFYDPIADIAVLGEPDSQQMWEECEAYGEFVAQRPGLELSAQRGGDAFILSLAGNWGRCRLQDCQRSVRISDAHDGLFGGMSGSPIVDANGRAIAVFVGAGGARVVDDVYPEGGSEPRLTHHLPRWLLKGADSLLSRREPHGRRVGAQTDHELVQPSHSVERFTPAQDTSMLHRPKLVFISACTPDPCGTGWERRAFSFLLGYSEIADVRLWFVPTMDKLDVLRIGVLKTVCKHAISFQPELLSNAKSPLRQALSEDVSSADLVHVYRLPTLASNISHKHLFFDVDEIYPQQLRSGSMDQTDKPLEKLTGRIALYKKLQTKCRAIFSCSSIETSEYLTITHVVPNVYATQEWTKTKRSADGLNMLFVGNMNFTPNVDAMNFFVAEVLPLLPSTMCFQVVGRSPMKIERRRAIKDLSQKQKRIETHFDVEHVGRFYSDAAVAVVPLREGGGTRIKILEAFSYGCPVVSTSKGCEGLGLEDDEHLLIRDEPKSFADACVRLSTDTELGNRLSANGRKVLIERYSQQAVNTILLELVEGMT